MIRIRFSIGIFALALLGANGAATAATNYFTEVFSSGDYDLGGHTMTFLATGASADYYEVTDAAAITDLIAFPGNGYTPTYYTLDDSGYTAISLPAGRSIQLYGVSYDKFWLFADGSMSMGAYSYSYPSVSYHFSSPHISPYMADLDQGAGGTISAGELDNGAGYVVTFENVPRWNNTNVLCTFQCIMWYGGAGAIQMAWLHDSDPGYAVVGISAGGGTPSAPETDLSLYFFEGDPNDMDGDNLPDSWETLYFGSYANCEPHGHGDTDGFDNMSEYIAGTIPNDADSFFSVGYSMGSSQIAVSWNSLTGRTYSVLHTDSLTLPFTNLVTGITPTPPLNTYSPPVDSANGGYFKAAVELAP